MNALLIDADERIDFILSSEKGYLIFKRSFDGVHYFAPRARTNFPEQGLKDNDYATKFQLDEEINITVIGLPNTDVGIILRFD